MTAELALRSDLSACEEIIARGLKSFVEVGTALMAIRDGKLYRASYPTFEAYCEDRWGFSRPRAYQLIEGAETTRALSTNVDTPVPANEGQARALSGLKAEQAAEVMTEAHQATNGKPTAAAIGQARLRIVPPQPAPRPPHLRKPVGVRFTDARREAKYLLDKICLLAEPPNSQHREHAAAWAREIDRDDTTLDRLDGAINYLTLLREELAR